MNTSEQLRHAWERWDTARDVEPTLVSERPDDATARMTFGHGSVIATFYGRLRSADIAAVQRQLLGRAIAEPIRWALYDFSEANAAEISASEVREFARTAETFAKPNAKRFVAIVAPRPLEFGLCRMFEAYVDGAATVMVMRNRSEAVEWLVSEGAPPTEF